MSNKSRNTKAILLSPENKTWIESLKEYPRETPNDIISKWRLKALDEENKNKTIIA
jgi:hypothetical protein